MKLNPFARRPQMFELPTRAVVVPVSTPDWSQYNGPARDRLKARGERLPALLRKQAS